MQILVDADACPVVGVVEHLAQRYKVPVTLFCDTNHVLHSTYATVRTVGAGADAVDFALMVACKAQDIVVTQDYGVAAMALGKGARCLHQSGRVYTNANIDALLQERHQAKKARRGGARRLKGPAKRTAEDDRRFAQSLEQLLQEVCP